MPHTHFNSALLNKFVNQKQCDVKCVCPDPTSESGESTISAHKLVLSIASDVFDTMFYGAPSKSEVVVNSTEIRIDDIQMPVFKLFLRFIYSEEFEFEDFETVRDFHYAAHKYNCEDALEFVIQYMMKNLKVRNQSLLFHEIACLYEYTELQTACLEVFSKNTLNIIESTEFMSANPDTIETIFKFDPLNINSEVDLINALERYIEHNKATDSEIAKKVRPAINCIRFRTLTPTDIEKTSLLSSVEKDRVLACLSPKLNWSEMPQGLSISKHKRHFVEEVCQMIRELSDVFSSKSCYLCVRNSLPSTLHSLWDCTYSLGLSRQYILAETFEKYKHTSLMEYDRADLKVVYNFYKDCGCIEKSM